MLICIISRTTRFICCVIGRLIFSKNLPLSSKDRRNTPVIKNFLMDFLETDGGVDLTDAFMYKIQKAHTKIRA